MNKYNKIKYGINEPIYRTETDSQTWRTDLWLPRGRKEGVGWIWSLGLMQTVTFRMERQ